MSLTSELTRLIRTKPIGRADLEAAALFVLDTLANAYAGRRSEQGRILLDWFRRERRDTGREAFVFGALVHILEMDDLHRESVTHPACVVIPPAWSCAARSALGGARLLEAVLHGYEAVCRIGNAVGAAHYRVWHNTATCGPYGAAFAAAALLGLRDEQTVWALGNAGTQSSGLWQFLEEGAMSKHLHAGRAAEAGLVAAELAAGGFTGPAAILEGRKGFFAAACPDAEPERVLAAPDGPWQLTLTSIKPWPSCRHTHPAIDAALELHGRAHATGIESIRIETYRAALDLCDQPLPTSAYEAKFSLQHCVAAALRDGRVTLDSFDAAARAAIAPLRARATVALSQPHEAAYPDRWGARLVLTTSLGETLTAERSVCKGDPESAVSADEMLSKAATLFTYGEVPAERARQITNAVCALPDDGALPDIRDLYRDQATAEAAITPS